MARVYAAGLTENRFHRDIQKFLLILLLAVPRQVDIPQILQCFVANLDFGAQLLSGHESNQSVTSRIKMTGGISIL